jgi:hypothetical protein
MPKVNRTKDDIALAELTMKTADTHADPEPLGKSRRKGLLVPADDLAVGRFYCVHGVKGGPTETWPIFGQSFQIKAINLPFVVGQLVSEPAQRITFDVRYLDLMAVTKEFTDAQRPDNSHAP